MHGQARARLSSWSASERASVVIRFGSYHHIVASAGIPHLWPQLSLSNALLSCIGPFSSSPLTRLFPSKPEWTKVSYKASDRASKSPATYALQWAWSRTHSALFGGRLCKFAGRFEHVPFGQLMVVSFNKRSIAKLPQNQNKAKNKPPPPPQQQKVKKASILALNARILYHFRIAYQSVSQSGNK